MAEVGIRDLSAVPTRDLLAELEIRLGWLRATVPGTFAELCRYLLDDGLNEEELGATRATEPVPAGVVVLEAGVRTTTRVDGRAVDVGAKDIRVLVDGEQVRCVQDVTISDFDDGARVGVMTVRPRDRQEAERVPVGDRVDVVLDDDVTGEEIRRFTTVDCSWSMRSASGPNEAVRYIWKFEGTRL